MSASLDYSKKERELKLAENLCESQDPFFFCPKLVTNFLMKHHKGLQMHQI